MIDDYTRLLEVAAESQDEAVATAAVKRLVEHLESAGRLKLLPSIAHELRRVKAKREALRPKVEVAHKDDAAHALTAAATLGIEAHRAEVNPSLVSGWRAQGSGLLVDRTGKRALIDIYKNVIG